MKVITLNNAGLDWQTRELAARVLADHPEPFNCVLSVKKGGSYVAASFLKSFPAQNMLSYGEIDLHRPSTHYKKGMLVSLLPHVPLWILNTMRFIEACMLKLNQQIFEPKAPHVTLPDDILESVNDVEVPEILVIDDAVDSGKTVRGIVNAILAANPRARVKVLAITVTTTSPMIMADYYIYYDSVLVRFPWSKDYKEQL